MRAGGSQELLPWASGHPSCPWGGGRRHSQPQGRGNRWEDLGTKKGGLCLNLKDSSPQDMHLPMCGCGGGPRAGRELVTFAGEPLHTGKATGTSRVCGGSSRNRDSVRLSIQAPVTCSTPALSLNGNLGRPSGHPWRPPGAHPGAPMVLPTPQCLQGPPGSPTQGPPWCYPSRSARRGSPRQPPGWRSTQPAGWLRVCSPHSGHPGPSANRCPWCCLQDRGHQVTWLTCWAHTCTLTLKGAASLLHPARTQGWAARSLELRGTSLSPRHTVPEGPSRLPGPQSQA